MPILSPDEIERSLKSLVGWQLHKGALERVIDCPDYPQALALLQQVGIQAEAVNHHPDLLLYYKRLTIRFHTHQPTGITHKDVLGAQAVESLLQELSACH